MADVTDKVGTILPHVDAPEENIDELVEVLTDGGYEVDKHTDQMGKSYLVVEEGDS